MVFANPMAVIAVSYQSIFYEHRLPPALPLLAVFGVSILLLWSATLVFESRREEFAEVI